MIMNDLKLQTKEVRMLAMNSRNSNNETDEEKYQNECQIFAGSMNIKLHEMRAETTAILNDALSDTLENLQTRGVVSTSHFAGEMREKVRAFGNALRNVVKYVFLVRVNSGNDMLPFLPTAPKVADLQTPVGGEMGNMHKLLERMKQGGLI
jgi:hypothetical protein